MSNTKEFVKKNVEKFQELEKELGISLLDYNSFDDYMRDLIACLDSEALQDYADSLASPHFKKMAMDEIKIREGRFIQ